MFSLQMNRRWEKKTLPNATEKKVSNTNTLLIVINVPTAFRSRDAFILASSIADSRNETNSRNVRKLKVFRILPSSQSHQSHIRAERHAGEKSVREKSDFMARRVGRQFKFVSLYLWLSLSFALDVVVIRIGGCMARCQLGAIAYFLQGCLLISGL